MLSLFGHIVLTIYHFVLTMLTYALVWACGMGLAYFIGTLLGIDYSDTSDLRKNRFQLPESDNHRQLAVESNLQFHKSLDVQRDLARRRAQRLHRRAQRAESRIIQLEKELRELKAAQNAAPRLSSYRTDAIVGEHEA